VLILELGTKGQWSIIRRSMKKHVKITITFFLPNYKHEYVLPEREATEEQIKTIKDELSVKWNGIYSKVKTGQYAQIAMEDQICGTAIFITNCLGCEYRVIVSD
jgi:hypothetical protein